VTPKQVVDQLLHQRLLADYSQRELSKRAGIHYTTLARIETGLNAPNLAILLKLLKALRIKPSDFFKEIENNDPTERKTIYQENDR